MTTNLMRSILTLFLVAAVSASPALAQPHQHGDDNPFLVSLNQAIAYGDVSAGHVAEYAAVIRDSAIARAEAIRVVEAPTFTNTVGAFDAVYADLGKALNNSFVLFWVSPDSLTRAVGLASYQMLDSLNTVLYSDRPIYEKVLQVAESGNLSDKDSRVAEQLLLRMRSTGVQLSADDLDRFRRITAEINDLTSQYSTNMNTDVPLLKLDEPGALGLPETLKSRYRTDQGTYEIPVISANVGPVLNNATEQETRKAFYVAYNTRAADENLVILDSLVSKRYQLAQLLGHDSYAEYALIPNMAAEPVRVWEFLDDLTERTRGKASADLDKLKAFRMATWGTPLDVPVRAWDLGYLKTSIEKSEFNVDAEEVRKYLPLMPAIEGMMEVYQQLLGLEFVKVENPSVWHPEVQLYNVFEDGSLVGRFYLDLFPRPNKESWFYGVTFTVGSEREAGYEIPVGMMLANFTRPSEDLPSLVTHNELLILFHEFGHVLARVSYKGRFAMQGDPQNDFGEAMSSIFENWIWDYDVLQSFAKHYETGEVLPRETFNNMLAARNLGSGLSAQSTLERSVYDMMLYDRFDPSAPIPTDEVWRLIGNRFVHPIFAEGTHPQASWIHVNTHPVYMYGYIWSDVYAQDMFTQFETNGLDDAETGRRYRELILANGLQRPMDEAVEEFLGRPMNNKAYIRSLGLDADED